MNRKILIFVMTSALSAAFAVLAAEDAGGPSRVFSNGNRSRNWVMHARFPFATDDLGSVHDSVPSEISYFDGLGRRIQTVHVALEGRRSGLADFVEYDPRGRVTRQWMATLANPSGAFCDIAELSEGYARAGQCSRDHAFTIFSYENTPAGRVVESRRPGKTWHEAPRGRSTAYLYNAASGFIACPCLEVDGGRLICGGTRKAGTVRVTRTRDEDGNVTFVFTDPFGREALRRLMPAVADKGSGGSYIDTHFVYDRQGRLRLVIPPDASASMALKGEIPLDDSRIREKCVIYGYDAMNRVTSVKYPGRAEIRAIHSPGGLTVYSRDGVQAEAGTVAYTVYDDLGRQAYSGIDRHDGTWDALAADRAALSRRTHFCAEADSANALGYRRTVPFETDDGLLQATFYDSYSFLSLFPGLSSALSYTPEEGCGSRGDTAAVGFSPKGLATGTAVRVTGHGDNTGGWLVTAIYYDSKGRPVQTRSTNHLGGYDCASLALSFDGRPLRGVTRHLAAPDSAAVCVSAVPAECAVPDGLTETVVRRSYTYDAELRVVSETMQVGDNGVTVTLESNEYDLLGRLSSSQKLSGIHRTTYSYTPTGELRSISSPGFSQTLYYELRPDGSAGCLNGLVSGQRFSLSGQPIGDGTAPLTLPRSLDAAWDYSYSGTRLTAARYSETSRRTSGTSGLPSVNPAPAEVVRNPDYSESYSYSPSGNLLSLRRNGFTGTTHEPDADSGQNVPVRNFGTVDDLWLTYDGAHLVKVSDRADDPVVSAATDFTDGADAGTEYTYDANGNMTSDLNKGIAAITYTSQNLPAEMTLDGGKVIRYSYDASGRRLSADYGIYTWVIDGGVTPMLPGGDTTLSVTVAENDTQATDGENEGVDTSAEPSRGRRRRVFVSESRRDYCGDFLYTDGTLERILHSAGWYSPGGTYTAAVHDHQGNLRATASWKFAAPTAPASAAPSASPSAANSPAFNAPGGGGLIGGGGGTIMPIDPNRNRKYENLTAYSPYGLPFADWQETERFLFSGKELDRTAGIMLYDFHARQYDPQLGRFTSQDPLQQKYPSLSPYLYCAANPISLTDPTGMYLTPESEPVAQNHLKTILCKKNELEHMNTIIQLPDAQHMMDETIKSMNDIYDMADCRDIEFNITIGAVGNVVNGTYLSGTNDAGHPKIQIDVEADAGKKSHEFRHGGQVARGQLTFEPSNYNINHEVDAYRAEFGTNGNIRYLDKFEMNTKSDKLLYMSIYNDHLKSVTQYREINENLIKSMYEEVIEDRVVIGTKPVYNFK